jgi:hypothetical protein
MNPLKIILNLFGRYLEKSTSREEIKNIIKKMKPIGAKKNLIRLGDDNDGGYIVPDDFVGLKYCFSAGVGKLIQFEKDCLQKYKIKSFLCDYNNINNPEIINHFDFTRKKITSFNNKKNLTLNSWINSKKKKSDEFILKIDIEGSEYEALLNIDEENLKKTRILIVEFHTLRDLKNRSFFRIFENVINKLQNFFYIMHLHPNNAGKNIKIHDYEIPDLLEVTFLRKDRISRILKNNKSYPLSIDQKCLKNKKDIFLSPHWYLIK